ncbi:MAG TPA: Na+/H+ antiporter family protein [Victivallales bacterium]|nr:Na+/H+ antiporter family protein [Victivallales bacterium]
MLIFNPVIISVLIMCILCLTGLNVIIAILLSAILGGVISGMPLGKIMEILVSGMGGNAETALSYILLGTLAAAIHKTGLASLISKKIAKVIKGETFVLILLIAFITTFSQNLIPVHIAFIPILIPPLLVLMNKLKIDRRAVACALTFGLKAPYITLPIGFGLIFHGIIADEMTANGIAISKMVLWKGLWFPGLGMVFGLLFAVFISYRKRREYQTDKEAEIKNTDNDNLHFTYLHLIALLAAISAFAVQLTTGSLPLGAVVAIMFMFIFKAINWKDINALVESGIGMMGFIAFVMLVASGYGNVIRETGAVPALVSNTINIIGNNKLIASSVMILMGLVITMGIGTSFGTIPILAVIYVPIAMQLGFTPLGTAILIGTAAALGDAGSPASDSTLGPTSGLNADGQHNHIWDTCVPTFLHYNIPLVIFGVSGSVMF